MASTRSRRGCDFEQLEARKLLTVFTPIDGPAFSTALNNAQLGDTIILNAGTTYTGNFILKNKTSGSGWITIQSSKLAQLPAEGVRVKPSDAVNMPRIQSQGGNASAIQTQYGAAVGAHHFNFVGLEIVGPSNNANLVSLVELGTSDPVQDTLTEMPHHFVIDRCYLRPNVNTASIRRAIALNSGAADITNCYIQEIHENGSDSQAIGGANGAGPYNIINNHLEAASENILFGGSGCFIPDTVPSDVIIRGNYMVKPLSWMGVYPVKNLFELKSGRRMIIEGNILENNWRSGQDGTAVVIKIDQYNSTRPWHVTEDITFRNNIIRHSSNAIAIQGRDWEGTAGTTQSPAGLVRRINISNNVWYDINKTPWANWEKADEIGGNFLYLTQGPLNVTVDHNTAVQTRTTVNVDSSQYPTSSFVFTNNIIAHNTYGVFGTGVATGDAAFDLYFADAGARFQKNAIMDDQNKSSAYNKARTAPSQYAPSIKAINYWPTSWANVGFVDQANANYRLAATLPGGTANPYKNIGTDGKDLGADIDAIEHATAGAINGIWFAYKVGSTMYVKFGDAELPILLGPNGSNITASKYITSLSLSGVTAISVSGSAEDDRLQVHAPISPPMTFGGSGGNDLLEILSGTQSFASDIGALSKNWAVHVAGGAGAVFNASQWLRSLSVDGIATLSAGGGKVMRLTDLAATGRLDLADNSLIWDYSAGTPIGAWANNAYDGLTGLIARGRNGGSWNGNGLVTSRPNAIAGAARTTLGVAEAANVLNYASGQAASFGAHSVDTTAVLVKYTWAGDANLSGGINGDDFFQIDSGFSGSDHAYRRGDFNFSGRVDADDYFLIDSNYYKSAGLLT